MQKESWYRSWFNSPYYHLLYKHRDDREAAGFIDKVLKYFNPPVNAHFLDLACGKGRHSIYINKKGYEVTGADLSQSNIEAASEYANERLHFYVHDMREVLEPGKFDYILNLFTSFGYFSSTGQNEKVLQASAANLKSKGKLLIDFLNVHQVLKGLIPQESMEVEGVHFSINRKVENDIIIKEIKVVDGSENMYFEEQVRVLTRQDFLGMLSRSGFEILDTFGNYQLDKFDEGTSPRLILIARKRL